MLGLQQYSGSTKEFRVHFNDIDDAVVPYIYDGMTFFILGQYELACMFGKDPNTAQKQKEQETRDSELKVRKLINKYSDLELNWSN